MTNELIAKWGNAYVRTITVKNNGEPIDISDYTIVFTAKRTLNRDDDENAQLKITLENDSDQVSNKGQARLIISAEENKFKPEVYDADFKVFDALDNPKNTEKVKYILKNVVGKDDL